MFCLDNKTYMALGKEQDWWCMACNSPLELGSEEVIFVGDDFKARPFPMLVHGECRAGMRVRLGLEEFWKSLDIEHAKAAKQRYERMRAAVASDTVGHDREEAPREPTEG